MNEQLLQAMTEALADYDRYNDLPLAERAEQHRLPEFAGLFSQLIREAVKVEHAHLASCGHPSDEDGQCSCAWWPERAPSHA